VRCPFCSADEKDGVIETRVSKDGREIRRRRQCEACTRRFTTYERIEESMPLVIKADGRREPFDRNKIEHGIGAAVAKRQVSREQVAQLALEVEREIGELAVSEIASRDIGERVLPRLRTLDEVAYVRFASIYRDFRDLDGFAKELDALRGEDTGRHASPPEDVTDEHAPVVPAPDLAPESLGLATAGSAEVPAEVRDPKP
jgi:transcriptional repressor NrdR